MSTLHILLSRDDSFNYLHQDEQTRNSRVINTIFTRYITASPYGSQSKSTIQPGLLVTRPDRFTGATLLVIGLLLVGGTITGSFTTVVSTSRSDTSDVGTPRRLWNHLGNIR